MRWKVLFVASALLMAGCPGNMNVPTDVPADNRSEVSTDIANDQTTETGTDATDLVDIPVQDTQDIQDISDTPDVPLDVPVDVPDDVPVDNPIVDDTPDTGPDDVPPVDVPVDVPASCTDNMRNGNETGIDCGGSCPGCAFGSECNVGADCQSGLCGPSNTCVDCVTATTCPGQDTECRTRTCNNGMCGAMNAPAGTMTATQTPGDCRVNRCNDSGGVVQENDDNDFINDNNACTLESCSNGTLSMGNAPSGTVCGTNFGETCNGQGVCRPLSFTAVRVGDGAAALTNASTATFLEVRSLTGTMPTNTVALPTAAAGMQQAFALSGTATSEGGLSRSADGRYLTLAGYGAAPGTASISGTPSMTVNRVIARVDGMGNVDTSTALTNAYSSNNVRGATSVDGTAFWASGTASAAGTNGVQYIPFGAPGTGTQLSSAPTNVRWCHVFASQLYCSSGSGAFVNVFTVGTGTQTTSGQTSTSLPGLPTSGASPFSFVFFDRNPNVAGVDTLYIADDRTAANGGGIQKYTFDGTTWMLVATFPVSAMGGARGLAGTIVGTDIVLIASTAEATGLNALVYVVDNGMPSPMFQTIAQAPMNTAYRGVAISPN